MIVTKEKFNVALQDLATYDTWCVDVETNGLNPYAYNQVCGVGIGGYKDGQTTSSVYYFPFLHHQGTNLGQWEQTQLIEQLNQVETLLGYNIKFDLRFLEKMGVKVNGQKLIDVIVLVRLCADIDVREFSLTETLKRYYGLEAAAYDIETKKCLKQNKWNKDFSMAPVELLGPYCEQDVYWTLELYKSCTKQILKMNQESVADLESQLTTVLYDMEGRGIEIDKEYAVQAIAKIDKRSCEVEEQIWKLTGSEFNISSSQQVGEVLNRLGIHSPTKTPKGKESWGEAALVQINNPIAGLIRQYRSLEKLKSTYLEPYIDLNTLHTTFCN
jgi:DNA polymerase-1